MSALKSVIIALPSKNPTPGEMAKASPKFNFTTSILMDKIKMEGTTTHANKKIHAAVGHMDLALPAPDPPILFKQENVGPRGKKRRLDHLTWEEKLQRKKLKNRVAAQTSRDRKKAKLDELEETVRLLKERNDMLLEECTMLRTQNESLILESKRLQRDKEEVKGKEPTEQVCSMCQARVGCTVPALGSAVSPINPLQQGGTVQTARSLTLTPSATILLKILTLYLLSKTYLANSKGTTTSNDWKNLQRTFCERLPLKWKQVLLNYNNRIQSKRKTTRNLTIEKIWWGRQPVTWKPVHPVNA